MSRSVWVPNEVRKGRTSGMAIRRNSTMSIFTFNLRQFVGRQHLQETSRQDGAVAQGRHRRPLAESVRALTHGAHPVEGRHPEARCEIAVGAASHRAARGSRIPSSPAHRDASSISPVDAPASSG